MWAVLFSLASPPPTPLSPILPQLEFVCIALSLRSSSEDNLMRKNMTRVQVSQVSGHYFLAIQSMDST